MPSDPPPVFRTCGSGKQVGKNELGAVALLRDGRTAKLTDHFVPAASEEADAAQFGNGVFPCAVRGVQPFARGRAGNVLEAALGGADREVGGQSGLSAILAELAFVQAEAFAEFGGGDPGGPLEQIVFDRLGERVHQKGRFASARKA